MSWNEESGPKPARSEDELLALVRTKAQRMRRRRVWSASVVAAVAVVAFGVAGALVATGGEGSSTLRVVGPGPETSRGAVTTAPALTSTSTSAPSPTTSSPPTSAPPTTPTTRAPSTTATTAAVVGPTTTPSPTTTTSTTLPPLPQCEPSEVSVTARPDKAVYAPGELVKVAVGAENRSGRACQPADPSVQFHDGAGNFLGGMTVIDMFTMGVPGQPRPTWGPGQTLSTTLEWRPLCPPTNDACPPGAYSVTATFGLFKSPPSGFRIT